MERLTIKHGNGLYTEVNPVDIVKNEYSINNYNQLLCRLGEYEDLEEQGLLLKLPCKVGDTVYLINEIEKEFDRKAIVTGIEIDEDDIFIMISDGVQSFSSSMYEITDFGKTVFLTQAEADEALKRMEREE